VTRQVRVDLRWSRPAEPAGIISTYHVSMATTLNGDDAWNVTTLTGKQLDSKFSVVDAPLSTILYFKVCEISQFLRHSLPATSSVVQLKRSVGCAGYTDTVTTWAEYFGRLLHAKFRPIGAGVGVWDRQNGTF